MNSSFVFQKKFTLEKRLEESKKIIEKYENKIPIIVEKSKQGKLPSIDKCKFLVPSEMTLGQFMCVLRRRIKIADTESIFIFVNNNVLPPTTSLVSTLYEEYKNEDGFLYMSYCNENVFGSNPQF
jgi:GABA(A) receptor-associated protein